MFYWLADLSGTISAFNIFRYLTVRTAGSMITALIFVFMFGPMIIDSLRVRQGKGQPIRADGPQSHFVKAGTPTMGGLMILLGLVVSTILWANPRNPYVWIVLAVTLGFGLVGFYDDYLKVTKQSHLGFSGRTRLLLETLIACAACYAVASVGRPPLATSLTMPVFKDIVVNLGWFFVIIGGFIIVGAGNAVNLTDGLDGLAIMPTVMVGSALGVFAYVVGNTVYAKYLLFPYVPGAGELLVFCAALAGAGLGFLWFNAYPAEVFMGDVGALSIGAALGTVAVIVRQEIVLFIMGGVFVAETLSVMIQVVYFKLSGGKRIFRMAPLHHHFEKKGWKEPTIVIRFWIIAVILAIAGLSTLKLR